MQENEATYRPSYPFPLFSHTNTSFSFLARLQNRTGCGQVADRSRTGK